MKIITVIGARPQFIKAATISRELRLRFPSVTEILVHTGQHYDANMSDVFFEELDIPKPDHYLGIGGGAWTKYRTDVGGVGVSHAESNTRSSVGLWRY